jgi:transcriptional regulator GlxA family with amidase domain
MTETKPTITLGLLLTDGFALMSYASIVEPFRAANVLAGRELYRWVHVSIDAQTVRASNGASLIAEQRVGERLECDTLFIFAASEAATFVHPATFDWLRQLSARGTTLAGISGGPFLLARAGLLNGYHATIHWDHHVAFAEAFPMLSIVPGLYVIDRRRVTCAGGIAGLDLAIEMIAREQGHALAVNVSDWFIRTTHRAADMPQRLSLRERYQVRDDRLLKVLAKMEASIETPPSRAVLAKLAGVSIRQLERLFLSHTGKSMSDTCLHMRLDQADKLLRSTGAKVTDIALACGFSASSHFSRAFKSRFGKSPTEQRRSMPLVGNPLRG